jgi:hypothetical protein
MKSIKLGLLKKVFIMFIKYCESTNAIVRSSLQSIKMRIIHFRGPRHTRNFNTQYCNEKMLQYFCCFESQISTGQGKLLKKIKCKVF